MYRYNTNNSDKLTIKKNNDAIVTLLPYISIIDRIII